MKFLKNITKRIFEVILGYFIMAIAIAELTVMIPIATVMYISTGRKFSFLMVTNYVSDLLEEKCQ